MDKKKTFKVNKTTVATKPVKATGASTQTTKTPTKGVKVPSKAVKAPVKTAAKAIVKTPTKAIVKAAPVNKLVKAPVKAVVKAPTKTSEKNLTQTPIKSPVNAVTKASGKTTVKVEKITVKKQQVSVDVTPSVTPYALKQSEEYMNKAQCAHFKELLSVWRVALMSKIDTTVMHLKDEPKHFADLNDRASQEEEFNLELRARDREAELVGNIDEALKRLNEGDYGYCEECGVEIGLRRLEARPTATLCIDCKTLAEVKERQSGV